MSDYQSRFKGNAIDTATNAVRKAVGSTAADNYDNNNTALIRGDTEASGSTTDNEILQADGSNKNKLKGSGISIDSIKKLKAGVTSRGYIMLSDLPGYDIAEDIVLKAEGNGSNKAVILYFGRNFFDSTSTNNSFDAFQSLGFSNLVGTRNVSAAVGSGNKVFAADASSASFVTTSALDGTFLGGVKAMDLEDNHEYLVVASFTLQEGSTLAPSAFNFYSGTSTTVIATAAPTGSSGVFYAVLKPSITSASGRVSTGKFAILDANATADAADTLDSLMIIDLTLLCDDSYNKTAAQAYAKYYTNTYWEGSATAYSQLIAGTTLHATNLIGPRYVDAATGNWFTPYTRNWFAWVPSGTKLYIQEFQANNSSTGYAASHYIKTIVLNGSSNSMGSAGVSIGGGYAYKIALDQGVTLNAGTVAFYYGKAADNGQPTPPSQTYSAAPLMQYIPDANLNDAPGTLYNLFAGSSYWVPHWQGVNLKPDGTGVFLTNNSIFDSSYSGWNSASEVTFNFKNLLIGLGLTQTDLNKEGVVGIGALSYQQNGSNFTFSSDLTNPNHTFVSYVINSVNNGILDVDNKINALMQKNLISTLPTAVGTYKYEVTTKGEEGRWSKEEETVTKTTLDNYNQALKNDLGISVELEALPSDDANVNYNVSMNDPTISMLLELLAQSGALTMSNIDPVVLHHIVSKGLAKKFFEYGDIIQIKKSDNTTVVDFQIIGFDEEEFLTPSIEHSMTIVQRYAPSFRWDMEELLFYASSAIAPGDYYIGFDHGQYGGGTTEDGYVTFHVNTEIPVGGGFRLPAAGAWRSTYAFSNLIGVNKITTYGAPDANGVRSSIEQLNTTEGQLGTYLGKFTYSSKALHDQPGSGIDPQYYNYTGRNAYGSNNYLTSDVRKYITSNAAAGAWWHAETIFDLRHPSYASAGWLNGYTDDFKNILGSPTKVVGVPTCESGNTSTVTTFNDKVFLLSSGEVGFSDYSGEGRLYGYFKQGLTAAGYTAANNGSCSARIKFGSAPNNLYVPANGRTSQISNAYYVIDGDYARAYWGTQADGSDKNLITRNTTVKFTCADLRCINVPSGNTGYIFLEGANSKTKIFASSTYWWMRSPNRGSSTVTYISYPNGYYNGGNVVFYTNGCAPACAII